MGAAVAGAVTRIRLTMSRATWIRSVPPYVSSLKTFTCEYKNTDYKIQIKKYRKPKQLKDLHLPRGGGGRWVGGWRGWAGRGRIRFEQLGAREYSGAGKGCEDDSLLAASGSRGRDSQRADGAARAPLLMGPLERRC
jgi:hypothetical protein